MNTTNNRTVFLDRDGVINRDSPDYIKHWDEFQFLPGSLEALKLLTNHGADIFITTNQSCINHRIVPQETLQDIHDRMLRGVVHAGGRIKDIFFCPHRPDENCLCRKPKPGLIQQARDRYGLNVKNSIMIGDSAKDIEAGISAGCSATILVRTGNGLKAQSELYAKQLQPTAIADDLLDAARMIIAGPIAETLIHV